jgi:aspartyl-tRNA(Asn)/glutamyl-tRNA(Gln) amidotransferase subunit A
VVTLDVVAAPHPPDPDSVPVDIDFRDAVDRGIDGLAVAYSPDLDVFEVDPTVQAVVEDALPNFEAAGATIEEVTVDHGLSMADLSEAVGTTFTAAMADAAAVIRENSGVDLTAHPEDVTDSLLAMIEQGRDTMSAEIAQTGTVRTELFDAIQSVFDSHDLLVTPTLAQPGFGLHDDLGVDEWGAVMTWPLNITGHPAASVPADRTEEGYPVGLQVVGPRYADETVLAASSAFEAECGGWN